MVIIPAGYAHVVHSFRIGTLTRRAAVTYGIQLNGGSFSPGDAALLHDALGDTILTQVAANVVMERTTMKAGPNDTGPFSEFVQDRGGTQAANMAPPNVSWLFKKTTALGGRANRGRMYMPGLPESYVDDSGNISSASRALMETQVDAFLARIQAEVLQMVILHNSVQLPTVVTDLSVDARAATQRRRLR